MIFDPSSTDIYGSSGFAGIGNALADVKGDIDRLGWDEVKVMIGIIFGLVLELCVILDC